MTTFKQLMIQLIKLLTSLLLSFSILSNPLYAADIDDENYDYALKLKEIGVFVGTDSGFELDRSPTRIEGLVMLVRLLGKESEALTETYPESSFTDVPNWARGYVNYAKSKGLTNGISATEFGSQDVMSAEMYVTFLLRSLGYDDSDGDFNWQESLTKAESIGLISSSTTYTDITFIRSHIAKLSYDALLTLYKNSPTTLAQYLVNLGVLDEKTAQTIEVIDNPAVVYGKLYALKDVEFYDIGENDCYVDVVASASISNIMRDDVYVHVGDANEDSHSLLNVPTDGYSTLVFRFIQENADDSNVLHILPGSIVTITSADETIPYASYTINESSQIVYLDLSQFTSQNISLFIEGTHTGKIYIYNLYLE